MEKLVVMSTKYVKSIRAFSDPAYDYYRLTKDFGVLKAGTIFYYDPNDHIYGSLSEGCLKNCWTIDGDCENGLCGGTVILHRCFAETEWFEKAERNTESLMSVLEPGRFYKVHINVDGEWSVVRL